MNPSLEQHEALTAAAERIESVIHAVAALEVALGHALDVATEAAAVSIMEATSKELGRVTESGARSLLQIVREGLSPIVKSMIEAHGAERMAGLMSDDVAARMGEAFAEQALGRIGHNVVQVGRDVQKKLADADRASAVPDALPVVHSNPVAMQVNPQPAPLSSGSEILKRIESIEARGKSHYPAKRGK
jgi:hypothetical protein